MDLTKDDIRALKVALMIANEAIKEIKNSQTRTDAASDLLVAVRAVRKLEGM